MKVTKPTERPEPPPAATVILANESTTPDAPEPSTPDAPEPEDVNVQEPPAAPESQPPPRADSTPGPCSPKPVKASSGWRYSFFQPSDS